MTRGKDSKIYPLIWKLKLEAFILNSLHGKENNIKDTSKHSY